MKEKNNTKIYFITALSFFVFLLILCFVAVFFVNKEKNKTDELSNDLSIANKEDVVALKRALRNYEASSDSVKSLLVDKDSIFDFIGEIERLAKAGGARALVQNIELFDVIGKGELVRNTGTINSDRTHGKFAMNMTVDGSWDSITSFLLKMENFPKHTSVEALRLNSVFDSKTGRQSWTANFNIITTTN